MRCGFEDVFWAQESSYREDFFKAAEGREILRSSVLRNGTRRPGYIERWDSRTPRTDHPLAAVENSDHLYEAALPYEDIFHGLGQLKGVVYHMKLKPESHKVIKPAIRVPVALQDRVKAELQRMEADKVIVKVTEPTEWSSYRVVVAKKEKVRICLGPARPQPSPPQRALPDADVGRRCS